MAAAVQSVWTNSLAFADEEIEGRSRVTRHQLDRASERLRQVYGALKAEPLSPRLEQLLKRLTQSKPA